MTSVWVDRQLYFQPPVEPVIVGLTLRAVDPQCPEADDGRRWVYQGHNRWMLHANGAWTFASVLREKGAAHATEFRCPAPGCGTIELAAQKIVIGHCSKCNAQTGFTS